MLVLLDYDGEGRVGSQSLPLELTAQVLEELACAGLAGVIPQPREGFLKRVSRVDSIVGGEQELRVLAGPAREILRIGQEGECLAFHKGTPLAFDVGVFLLVSERLPHFHHDQANPFYPSWPQ